MNAAVDPWAVTAPERTKYLGHFTALKPQNDIVTGQQARGFFLQSQLPANILGEIWSLADTDSDGKMNIVEFSIACKLISLKLRGFEIPKALPPVLIASLSSVGGTPTRTPTGISSQSPIEPIKQSIAQPLGSDVTAAGVPPPRPAIPPQPVLKQIPPLVQQPILLQQQQPPPLIPNMGIPSQPILPVGVPIIPAQPLVNPIGVVQPLIQPLPQTLVSPTSVNLVQLPNQLISPPGSLPMANITALTSGIVPGATSPPNNHVLPDKVPSLESPSGNANVEWAIKGPAKLKFTQLFNTTDRTRCGFLTGAQARNLMVQSKLPQTILAQIWSLSDMDADGRLGCEEFVLAMYLCDLAIQGEAIPAKLPPELIPPSFRKVQSRHGSIVSGAGSVSNSRHGSVSSQGAGSVVVSDGDPSAGLPSQISFEDKRKENFDKGQAELERRRKVLQDIQLKEQAERERKEREEAERREKARLEAERKQQEEIERQLQIQRELEQEKEEKRKREIEQKESARKEMEKQRQLEWEKQRISEMQQQRQREQEKLLKLKAQNQTANIELSTLNEKIKELSQKICDTRVSVTSVKTVIDGMRTTRDTQMTEMTTLKQRIKDQNNKLVQLSQEKAKLDSKTKSSDTTAAQEAFSNKQMHINQLRGKLESAKEEIDSKQSDVTVNSQQLSELKSQLKTLIETCEDIYSDYNTQRNQLNELKNNKKNDSLTSAWDTAPDVNAWPVESTPVETSAIPSPKSAPPGYVRYRAIYEFSARNADEITFQPGDTVMVPLEQNAEPGWLAGEINGSTGWFPETYVEKYEDEDLNGVSSEPITYNDISTTETAIPISTDVTVPEEAPAEVADEIAEYYISCYPYESAEVGDLVFDAGEYITVIKKDGDWWTGTIGTRTGIFPSNYVQPVTDVNTNETDVKATNNLQQNIADDARNQEEADTEVSEINTQQKAENVQEIYSRPMSSSSTGFRGSKKGEVAQVIAPYEATSNEQLSLQRGQLIMIRKKTDSGWWEGELQARGRRRQIGWFPATYVKVLQSGRLSGRSTPVSGGRIQMNETILDKVIALYPYKAQNDDELSFEKDDIISVLGRDEPEWWRGECQGLTGLFPSNYVGPFVTSG